MTNRSYKPTKEKQDALSSGTYGGTFEIHVRGQLDESWSDWLEGLEVRLMDNGEMILSGYIKDQAALMGVLNKLYGLNLALLSVSEVGQKKYKKGKNKMENTNKFNPDPRNISMSAAIIDKIHNCADCPIRQMAIKRPQSIFARLHIWHKTWWPGWKAHQARTCSFAARANTNS